MTLQNGTVWEVEISDRATTGSWRAGNFVGIRRIWAPRDGYEWQLTKSENVDQVAAVKLVGRRRASGVVPAEVGGHAVEVREQPPLVDAHQIELVADASRPRCRDHELRERVAQPVLSRNGSNDARLSEQRVNVADWATMRASSDGGSSMQANGLASSRHGEEQRRRRERPLPAEDPLQILNQQGQLRQAEAPVHAPSSRAARPPGRSSRPRSTVAKCAATSGE